MMRIEPDGHGMLDTNSRNLEPLQEPGMTRWNVWPRLLIASSNVCCFQPDGRWTMHGVPRLAYPYSGTMRSEK